MLRGNWSGLIAILLLAVPLTLNADDAIPDHPSQDGLVLWLDASDAASISANEHGNVLAWVDHRDHAYKVSSENQETTQPQLVPKAINWKPAIRFSGEQFLTGATALREAKGPVSIFIVARPIVDPAHPKNIQQLLCFDNFIEAGGLFKHQSGDLTMGRLTTEDGVGNPGDTVIYYGEADSMPIGPFMLGKSWRPSLKGDIAEVLIYDRPFLSAGERQLVTDYLHAKWNAKAPLAPGEWTRDGDLGPLPEPVFRDRPLSYQNVQGVWVLDPKFSDDFTEGSLDLKRYQLAPEVPSDPGWRGRQPALFLRSNTEITNGMLEITDRKGDVSEMAQYPGQGYEGYTTGFIETIERSGYGYYEIKARPHNSAFCSAFWMTDTGLKDTGTEIDIFEIGAKAHDREHDDNMTAHVWGTPQDKRHWAVGSRWKAPWKLGDEFSRLRLRMEQGRTALVRRWRARE